VLSSAIGHLLELTVPGRIRGQARQVVVHPPAGDPAAFHAQPDRKDGDRLKLLTRLIKRKDVDGLVNACDAGREGELIFRYIVAARQAPTSRCAACGCSR
jgi:DNA topoisomerase-3